MTTLLVIVVLVLALVFSCVTATQALTIDTVPVGDPGNLADTRYATPGYGDVDYAYRIGKYEITNAQYAEFLNAVAATDTYGVYDTRINHA